MEQLAPFTVAVPEEVLTDLRARLERTRFIDDFAADEWTYGVSLTYLRELCDHWRTTFDWRAQEAILNGFDQLETHVDGQHLHLIHARSPNPAAMPLLLVHGWPGSIFEFVKVIGPLSRPAAHGGPADAFHVVAPSIPGYGFSGPTRSLGGAPSGSPRPSLSSWIASATGATGRRAATGERSSRPRWRGPTAAGASAACT